MEIKPSQRLSFPVDPEHSALRFTVVGIFVLIGVLSFLLYSSLVPNSGVNLLAILLALGTTTLLSQVIERFLKKRWPSGRQVEIDEGGVRLTQHGEEQAAVSTTEPVETLFWRFEVKKRSHVPKGWFMLAVALVQDGRYLPVYTFMSPTDVSTLALSGRFTSLRSKKEEEDAKKSRIGGRDDLWLAGEQRRLRQAEEHRWTQGAEMTSQDFQVYLNQLQAQFPEWLP